MQKSYRPRNPKPRPRPPGWYKEAEAYTSVVTTDAEFTLACLNDPDPNSKWMQLCQRTRHGYQTFEVLRTSIKQRSR
jgi:hypothetical protein